MKFLKRLAAIVVLFILTLGLLYIVMDEPVPVGTEGLEAEQMADRMLAAINDPAWQETEAVSWDFDGRHQLVWDKRHHLAQVSWAGQVVQIDIDARKGVVLESLDSLNAEKTSAACLKAWEIWANDSYWLNPISKIRDDGTSREAVDHEGRRGLLVTYNKGGVTPGDSYLWYLDERGLPYRWKMWVNIIPVGGVSSTWEGWEELSTGVKVSTVHKNFLTLRLRDVKGATSIEALAGRDIFEPLIRPVEPLTPF